MYYCYILYSAYLDESYVGFTGNLQKRLIEHKGNPTLTTRRAKDYHLVWYCAFFNKESAFEFERYLKTGSGRAFAKKHKLVDYYATDDIEIIQN